MPQPERQLKNQMKIGAAVTLFGLLCPFFWFRFFAGDYGFETLIYGIHSGVFIAIGLALVGNGWVNLKRGRAAMQAFSKREKDHVESPAHVYKE